MKEAPYSRATCDLTMSVASTLLRLNPAMTFIYVSGANADSTERGRTTRARVSLTNDGCARHPVLLSPKTLKLRK